MSRFFETCVPTILAVLTATHTVGAADVVRLSPEQLARAGVETSAVQEADFGSRLRAVGQVVRSPGSTLTLKTIAGGRVESLQAAPGDMVSTGEVVVTLHSHELLTMQSDLLLAVDQVKVAEQRLAAGRELLAVEGISQLEYQRREQEALSARLRSDILREELLDHGFPESSLERVLAGNGLDPHLPVPSPVDGVVLEVTVQEQEWVQPYAPLLVVGDPARVELDLQLAPDQATAVAVGDLVEFEPVGRSGTMGRATVITRVPQIDPSTRTIRIRARIESGTQACFPGAFVDATVSHGAVRRSLVVPQSAVISVAGRDSVFVATGDNEFTVRPVDLGQRDGDRYEVVGGLEAGEQVATAGVFLLKSTLVKGDGGED
jgi:cobalt-zinc-cadmium efflux system membrane fusion protein